MKWKVPQLTSSPHEDDVVHNVTSVNLPTGCLPLKGGLTMMTQIPN